DIAITSTHRCRIKLRNTRELILTDPSTPGHPPSINPTALHSRSDNRGTGTNGGIRVNSCSRVTGSSSSPAAAASAPLHSSLPSPPPPPHPPHPPPPTPHPPPPLSPTNHPPQLLNLTTQPLTLQTISDGLRHSDGRRHSRPRHTPMPQPNQIHVHPTLRT